MALRDFDRVRERVELRLEVRHLAGGALIVVGAVSGAFWGGYRYGKTDQQPVAVACAPSDPGPQRGVAVAELPEPAPMPSRRPPVLPRKLAASAALEDAPLAPTLADLARLGMVAAAHDDAPIRVAGAEESAEDATVDATAESPAGEVASALAAAAVPAEAADVAIAARPLPDAALRSEQALAAESVSSHREADDQPCRVDSAYALPVTEDGRALWTSGEAPGRSEEVDLRARTVAVLDASAMATLANPAPAEPDAAAGTETADAEMAGTEAAGTDAAAAAPATVDASTAPAAPARGGDQVPAVSEPVEVPAAGTATSAPVARRAERDERTYYVQVKALRSETEAEAFLRTLHGKGWKARIQRAEIAHQGVFFRIRLGPYRGLARAQAVSSRLQRSTGLDSLVMSTAND